MKYYLVENKLTEETNYSARVKVEKSHDMEALIKLMLSKRNLVSETDIVAVLNAFFEEARNCVDRGEGLNLPLFNMSYSISGVFDDDDDSFDPEVHHLNVNLQAGTQLKEAARQVSMQRIEADNTLPMLKNFTDVHSGEVNSVATPGNLFTLTGSRLKIAGDAQAGIYFVAADGTPHPVGNLATNNAKKLIGLIPALPKGEYTLLLKTQYAGGNTLSKTVKTVTGNIKLQVK